LVLAPFKNGAFNLAAEFQIPIVPQVYFDCKRLFSWDIFKGGPGVLRIHQYKFLSTEGISNDEIMPLKEKTFGLISKDLENDAKFMKDTNRKK